MQDFYSTLLLISLHQQAKQVFLQRLFCFLRFSFSFLNFFLSWCSWRLGGSSSNCSGSGTSPSTPSGVTIIECGSSSGKSFLLRPSSSSVFSPPVLCTAIFINCFFNRSVSNFFNFRREHASATSSI